jgi:xanthine dehydrogenase accessory factor
MTASGVGSTEPDESAGGGSAGAGAGSLWTRLRQALEQQEPGVLLTVVAGDGIGSKLLVLENGERTGDESLAEYADTPATGTLEAGGRTILAEVVGPALRLVIFGAGDMAEALCRIAATLGWETIVVDPRPGLATRERVPSADELLVKWPDEVAELISPRTAVVSLVHETRLDAPAVQAGLERNAWYVGALGSTRTKEKRLAALAENDVQGVERISGPIGLKIGAEGPAEIALSIAAEILGRYRGALQ